MKTLDQISPVGEFNILQVREAITETDDNGVQKTTYHRFLVHPGDDVSGMDEQIKAAVKTYHTPEVIAAYQASISEPA